MRKPKKPLNLKIEPCPVSTITIPSYELDAPGIQAVVYYLVRAKKPAIFPHDWSWELKVTAKGQYTGLLTTRIAKFCCLYKNPLSKDQKTRLGNLISQHSPKSQDYHYDITRDFDWKCGDFGDYDSCFWGGRNAARGILTKHKALALRVYRDSKGQTGYARCWVLPRSFKNGLGEDGKECYVLFNAYGIPLQTLAAILMQHSGLPCIQKSVVNNGADDGTLYLNKGTSFILGPEEVLTALPSSLDLHVPIPGDEEDECVSCGETLGEDDDIYEDDGDVWCDTCWHRAHEMCPRCHRWDANDNVYHVDGHPEFSQLCFGCCETVCTYCDEGQHEVYTENRDVMHVVFSESRRQNIYACDDCADQCEHCEEWTLGLHTVPDGEVCRSCRDYYLEHGSMPPQDTSTATTTRTRR